MTFTTLFFFFFQAEDGIRDLTVTGVQTCALPISGRRLQPAGARRRHDPDLGARRGAAAGHSPRYGAGRGGGRRKGGGDAPPNAGPPPRRGGPQSESNTPELQHN